MAFDEVEFPDKISYGSSGSPSYKTDVTELESGHEDRAALLEFPRYIYDVSFGVKTKAQLVEVHTFFHLRKAKFRGFRFKDHFDFQASDSPLVVTGAPTVQLTKRYTDGLQTLDRVIRKPEAAGFSMRLNAVPFAAFSGPDTTTGIITLTPDTTATVVSGATATVTGLTQANPAVVTTLLAHGFTTGEQVRLQGVVGMTEVNDTAPTVTVLSPTTFELDGVDSSAFTAYTSGGTVFNPGITRENPGVVRAVAHGFTTGNQIYLTSIDGMTEVNDQVFTITVIDANHFSIGVDTTGFTLFTSNGTAERYVQTSDVLDWSGEFRVPVRFEADALPAVHDAFDIGAISSIPLMEVLRD